MSQTVPIDEAATFTVTATGTAPLSYQWSENGVIIAGATSASYTTPSVSLGSSGSTSIGLFEVTVSNAVNSVKSNAAMLSPPRTFDLAPGLKVPANAPTISMRMRLWTEGGEGRTIPLNSDLFAVLTDYVEWYKLKYGPIRPEWYVFPFGSPQPTDPTRHVTILKTVWSNIREKAGIKGRWHDNRHTLVTELAESGVGDQTIMDDIAGYVSKQMLRRYSHIQMEAKRNALESVVKKRVAASTDENTDDECSELPVIAQHFEGGYPQKSPQSGNFEGHCSVLEA